MKLASWTVVPILAAITALAPTPATPQQGQHFTPEDSAAMRVAMLRLLLDSLATAEARERPIWIVPYSGHHRGDRGPVNLGPTEFYAIAAAFPQARLAESSDSLFLCPPGVSVRMPLTGCPIVEDGLIVSLGAVHFRDDGVETAGALIESAEGSTRTLTWRRGLTAVFHRVNGGWWLLRITERSRT